MKYCCKPFEAHVKCGFFHKMWEKNDPEIYRSGWGVLVISTEKSDDGDFVYELPKSDINYMPLLYCNFCGSRLDEKEEETA